MVVRAGFQALAHGVVQGEMTYIQGGKFWSGFAAGSISSIVSSGWQSAAGNFANTGAGTMFFGTISGGAGAALTGGNFWQGAVTGLVVSGLNHSLHDAFGGLGDPPKRKKMPSLKEANEFYRKNKNINAVYEVDASTVDLNFLDVSKWTKGKTYLGVQTLYSSKKWLSFGSIKLEVFRK